MVHGVTRVLRWNTTKIATKIATKTVTLRQSSHLKAGLAVIEETPVSCHEDDQGPVLGLTLAALDLRLQVPSALQRDRLRDILTGLRVDTSHLHIALGQRSVTDKK